MDHNIKFTEKIKLLLKSLFYQGNWNYENMQGTGFYYLLEYINNKFRIGIDKEALRKMTGYFNTNPFLITFILGIWCKEYQNNSDPNYTRKIYGPALSALGDRFFWHTLKPLSFILSIIICFYSPVISLIFYLIFFNIFHFYFLYNGFSIGYAYGRNTIEWFNRIKFTKWNTIGEGVILFSTGLFLSILYKIEVNNLNGSVLMIFAVFFLLTLLIVKKINISLALLFYTTLLIINMVLRVY
jgi:mannose/fructose/N-acetylgalactosamine-specific phosphotransferase system component IID